MKKLGMVILCCLMILSVQAQGIKFSEGLSWKQIKEKAQTENKYIFVDCYATWCGPCKMMDKNVYPNDSAGSEINSDFIAVKVQMDTSKNDNAAIQAWYADAKEINRQYAVTAYPTFLFFSPQGKLVHEAIGYYDVKNFIALAKDALNPQKQYYTLLENYRSGKKDYTGMAYLATTAATLGDEDNAKQIGMDYIDNYLSHLSKDKLFTKDNIQFLAMYASDTKSSAFRLLYNNGERIKKVMNTNPYYIPSIVGYVITREEIDPEVIAATKSATAVPDWNKLNTAIRKKYNNYYADRLVREAVIRWYGYKKDWPEYTRNIALLLDKYAVNMSNYDINSQAWNLCQISKADNEIAIAAKAMERVVRTEKDSANMLPASIDTYANLLYRLGRREEAIREEEKALYYATNYEKGRIEKENKVTLEKMKRGETIWPLKLD